MVHATHFLNQLNEFFFASVLQRVLLLEFAIRKCEILWSKFWIYFQFWRRELCSSRRFKILSRLYTWTWKLSRQSIHHRMSCLRMYQQGCNRTSRHDHNEMVRWAWLSLQIVSNIRKLSRVAICCIWYACRCYFGPFIFAPLFVITWLQNSRFYDFDPHSISARLRVWSIRTIWNRPKSDHRKDWISIIESGSRS